jgi:hypothetical protein
LYTIKLREKRLSAMFFLTYATSWDILVIATQ